MDIRKLCTNCLLGTMENGVCTNCHKSVGDRPPRPLNSLPDRHILKNNQRDSYLLGKVIGKGGFGITYLAWDIRRNQRVIVKELYPHNDVQRDADGVGVIPLQGQEAVFQKYRQRFRQEAEVLGSFRDAPEVVNVYDIITANHTEYYSMEYLNGCDLKYKAIQRGRIPWKELSEQVKYILRTLDILHSKGLIHRDISPDNIFLVSDTEAKLIDFGSVRSFVSDQGLTTILKQVYAPLEQYYTDGDQGPWTDIYSLCATLYHVMSGRQPAQATSRGMDPGRDTLVPIQTLCPDLPPNVARAITKGMAVEVKDRYKSAREMAADLYPGETAQIFDYNTKPKPKPDPEQLKQNQWQQSQQNQWQQSQQNQRQQPQPNQWQQAQQNPWQQPQPNQWQQPQPNQWQQPQQNQWQQAQQNPWQQPQPNQWQQAQQNQWQQVQQNQWQQAQQNQWQQAQQNPWQQPQRNSQPVTGNGEKTGVFQKIGDFFRSLFSPQTTTNVPPRAGASARTLRCIGGTYKGKTFGVMANSTVTVGRQEGCTLKYPWDSQGISRTHLTLTCDSNGNLFARDENSRYGTTLGANRMQPNCWYQTPPGTVIGFAGEKWQVE